MKKIIILFLCAIILLLNSCGLIFPYAASIIVKNQKNGYSLVTEGFTIKDVTIMYDKNKKKNISVGDDNTYEVFWLGTPEYEVILTFSYTVKDASNNDITRDVEKQFNISAYQELEYIVYTGSYTNTSGNNTYIIDYQTQEQ